MHVSYQSDHQGHECDLAHVNLSREHRLQIAGMLAAGIPMDDVIDRMQSNVTKLSNLQFITKLDLVNIMRDFNITKGNFKNMTDAFSIEITGS